MKHPQLILILGLSLINISTASYASASRYKMISRAGTAATEAVLSIMGKNGKNTQQFSVFSKNTEAGYLIRVFELSGSKKPISTVNIPLITKHGRFKFNPLESETSLIQTTQGEQTVDFLKVLQTDAKNTAAATHILDPAKGELNSSAVVYKNGKFSYNINKASEPNSNVYNIKISDYKNENMLGVDGTVSIPEGQIVQSVETAYVTTRGQGKVRLVLKDAQSGTTEIQDFDVVSKATQDLDAGKPFHFSSYAGENGSAFSGAK